MGWENSELMADAPGAKREPLVSAEPSPRPRRSPMIVSPVVLQAQMLGKIGEASVKSGGKPAFVRMPCFGC